MTSTLLLSDPHRPDTFGARRQGRLAGRLAQLQASALDRRLALGASPESGHLLAIRAQQLVGLNHRAELAGDLERLLVRARGTPAMRSPRAALNRSAIARCEPQIRALINALWSPLPVPASGPAMVSWLLSDGCGPFYNRRRAADLPSALTVAASQLNPLRSLVSCG